LRRAIYDAAKLAVWSLEPGADSVRPSPELRRLLDVKSSSVGLDEFCTAIAAGDARVFKRRLRAVRGGSGAKTFEHSAPGGSRRMRTCLQLDEDGATVLGVTQEVVDLTTAPELGRARVEVVLRGVTTALGPTAIFDHDRRCLAASPAWERIVARGDGSCLGKRVEEMAPGVSPQIVEMHKRAVRGEAFLNYEEELYREESGEHWLQCEYRSLTAADQSFGGYMVQGREITSLVAARQDAEINAGRLSLALYAAQAGVYEIDFVNRTFWCSPEFEQLVGRTMTFDEATCPAWPMTHPDDVERVRQWVLGRQDKSTRGTLDLRLIMPDGEIRWRELQSERFNDESGRLWKARGLVIDIDARKRQELAFLEAQRSAEAATEAKSQFLANMSHEIRTPMNGVLGVLHLLEREQLSADGRVLLTEAQGCGRMLAQLLNDVIDFSKIEAGRLELAPEPLDVADVLDSVVGMLRPQAEAKGLKLTSSRSGADGWIVADPVRLRQALFNLIGNAVKFTAAGRVEARLLVAEQGDGARRVRFEIEDTGVGIPSDAQRALFQRFTQADGSTARQFGGSGLGLAITRTLAEMMGGEVGFTSCEGAGSTFWFDVPAPAAARGEQPGPELLSGDLSGLSILVVEDNPTNRLVASKILEGLGATVDVAVDGLLGVEAVRDARYDLVLMDVQMPRMDGVEATRCIRALKGPEAATPIIGLTANALSHQRSAYLAAGMDGVSAKPISPADLLAEIARVMAAAASLRPASVSAA
jgi:signal transduction histidine kinase/CheY-like chemotaxis protein